VDDTAQCNLCGCHEARPLYPELGMIECTDCGLVRADSIPDAGRLKELYSEEYFRSSDSGALGYDDYIADRAKISKTFTRRMAEIEKRLGRKGRLLDIGCATGFALDVARERGWETRGIEVSQFASEYARSELGLDVSSRPLKEAGLEQEGFDVITMWDYIEHSPDPAGEFEIANRLLRSGGLLVLTTPDIASLPARISGRRWMGIKQEEHLFYFSPDTIGSLLKKHSFEPSHFGHVGKYIDIDFFIKRIGLYSTTVERALSAVARVLGIGEKTLYVNPFDIMIVYGRKVDSTR
jgi:2-polyprenyl-3-methyl-5-hydroxy-6-metoxy-1,4-benzoquinol methylase